jgi:hypothetical protein
MNKQLRLDEDAIRILREQRVQPSDAIRLLESKAKATQVDTHDEKYWVRLENLIKDSHKPEPHDSFKRAADYAKKIGPIEKDEEYVEPVGRQGRDIR